MYPWQGNEVMADYRWIDNDPQIFFSADRFNSESGIITAMADIIMPHGSPTITGLENEAEKVDKFIRVNTN